MHYKFTRHKPILILALSERLERHRVDTGFPSKVDLPARAIAKQLCAHFLEASHDQGT